MGHGASAIGHGPSAIGHRLREHTRGTRSGVRVPPCIRAFGAAGPRSHRARSTATLILTRWPLAVGRWPSGARGTGTVPSTRRALLGGRGGGRESVPQDLRTRSRAGVDRTVTHECTGSSPPLRMSTIRRLIRYAITRRIGTPGKGASHHCSSHHICRCCGQTAPWSLGGRFGLRRRRSDFHAA
jgi:hypothetical protein